MLDWTFYLKRGLIKFFGGLLLGFLAWAYYPAITDHELMFKWEGFLDSKINFRDTGASINECLGKKVLKEEALYRSSRFFSGWPCDKVGSPDEIYSLDAYAGDNEKTYCRHGDQFKIGADYQTIELSDLEFLKTWENPAVTQAVCKNLSSAIRALEAGRKVLIQCDAGRDRTGAVSAILAAYFMEKLGPLTPADIKSLECDYRKSKSLKEYKYGRIESFLLELIRIHGSIHNFLKSRCFNSTQDL